MSVMAITRTTVPPSPAPREHCEAETPDAHYSAERLGSGWLCSVRTTTGRVTLFAEGAHLLAEPYASELRAFVAACEAGA